LKVREKERTWEGGREKEGDRDGGGERGRERGGESGERDNKIPEQRRVAQLVLNS